MARVKICGINDPAAMDAAVDAGADWIGFVFFRPSPRFVTPSQARELSSRRPGGSLRVGLFVDPTETMIAEALDGVSLDILQLHGAEECHAVLRASFGRPIWRAVGVATARDLPVGMNGSDALLIDAKRPEGAALPGGNGVCFDWTVPKTWRAPGPWLLAGGLDPGNVAEAVRISGTGAVDVSSGVERERGRKDPDLIRSFIDIAHAA